MNIYHISYKQAGRFHCDAVVVDHDGDAALGQLALDPKYNSDIKWSLLGTCGGDDTEPRIVAWESL